MEKHKLPELLAPAGSAAALEAAIAAGADAVYLGGSSFNARMNARNFTNEELEKAVKRAHSCGVRVYVTLNTLITEREYPAAMKYVGYLYSIGTDALICADLGLSEAIAEKHPDFPLHASTQAGAHNAAAGEELKKLGFSRMVAARELSLENILTCVRESPIEIEIFIHGALCVCHSGQCLMSSVIGGRSGNRGECAQPCRMQYNGSYPISLKDSCLAGHIKEIIASGAASLKIEGRMKSPDYVYGVTAAYRRLLDERRDATPKELEHLAALFSRGGFTDGYFTGHIGKGMNGIRSDEDKQNTRGVREHFTKAKADPEKEIVPLRYDFGVSLPEAERKGKPMLHKTARFYDPAQIPKTGAFDIIYLPLEKYDPKKANGILLPPVITDSEKDEVRATLLRAKNAGAEHVMVSNPGHIALAEESGMTLHADYRFNLYSAASRDVLYSLGFEDALLSPELTLPQIRDIKGDKGVIVYGRLPLMLLEKRLNEKSLIDRRKAVFPVIREAGRSLVLNSCPVWMADKGDALKKAGINHAHFIFTTETEKEVQRIIRDYESGKAVTYPIRRIKG